MGTSLRLSSSAIFFLFLLPKGKKFSALSQFFVVCLLCKMHTKAQLQWARREVKCVPGPSLARTTEQDLPAQCPLTFFRLCARPWKLAGASGKGASWGSGCGLLRCATLDVLQRLEHTTWGYRGLTLNKDNIEWLVGLTKDRIHQGHRRKREYAGGCGYFSV